MNDDKAGIAEVLHVHIKLIFKWRNLSILVNKSSKILLLMQLQYWKIKNFELSYIYFVAHRLYKFIRFAKIDLGEILNIDLSKKKWCDFYFWSHMSTNIYL